MPACRAPRTLLLSFEYDHFDRRSLLLRGNGRRTLYEYDRASRLSALVNTSFGSAADVRFEFTYNPASQIVTRWSSNDAYAWTGHFNENRTGTANGLNQLTQVGAKSLSHDVRGNVTAFGTKSFTYDSENMMKSGPGSTDLHYDPALRLEQVVSGGTTRLAYDGLDRVAEHDGANAVQRRYVFGPGIDEPLVWYEGSGTTDRRFLEADERGSVILVGDTAGATLATNRYDEYGQPQATNLGKFGYTGQAWLPTIGEWYYKARMYDPELGRFNQTDPIDVEGGINLYAYVGNDPINWIDPLGLRLCAVYAVDEEGNPLPGEDSSPSDCLIDAMGTSLQRPNVIRIPIKTRPGRSACKINQTHNTERVYLETIATLGDGILIAGVLTANPLPIAVGGGLSFGADAFAFAESAKRGDTIGMISTGASFGAGRIPGGRIVRKLGGAAWDAGLSRKGQFLPNHPARRRAQDIATSRIQSGAGSAVSAGVTDVVCKP